MEYTDVIYGKKIIPNNFAAITNTDVFQRLKNIRQLGLLYLDFPVPNHSRYEHCIGTYFRAEQMLGSLETNSPSINETNRLPKIYRNAVLTAALLHDVGHGPFSHSWERVNSNYSQN